MAAAPERPTASSWPAIAALLVLAGLMATGPLFCFAGDVLNQLATMRFAPGRCAAAPRPRWARSRSGASSSR
jgi:hypothetical protein